MANRLDSKLINLGVAHMKVGEGRAQERRLGRNLQPYRALDLGHFDSQLDSPMLTLRTPSVHMLATVNIDRGPGDKFRIVRHQKQHPTCDILGTP